MLVRLRLGREKLLLLRERFRTLLRLGRVVLERFEFTVLLLFVFIRLFVPLVVTLLYLLPAVDERLFTSVPLVTVLDTLRLVLVRFVKIALPLPPALVLRGLRLINLGLVSTLVVLV